MSEREATASSPSSQSSELLKTNYGEVSTLLSDAVYRLMCVGPNNCLYLLRNSLREIEVMIDRPVSTAVKKISVVKLKGQIKLEDPRGMVYSKGKLYIADRSLHQILQIDTGENKSHEFIGPDFWQLQHFAGSGEPGDDDGEGMAATFFGPFGITANSVGMLYVADEVIRSISPSGRVLTLCGNNQIGTNEGSALAHEASFLDVRALCYGSDDQLFFVDQFAIRRVGCKGKGPQVYNLCGKVDFQGFSDGDVDEALFFTPKALVEGIDGRLYVGDGPRIRVVSGDLSSQIIVLQVSTIAGSLRYKQDGPDGFAEECGFGSIASLAMSTDYEHIYILHDDIDVGRRGRGKLRKISILDQLTALFRKLDIDIRHRRKLAKHSIHSIKSLSELSEHDLINYTSKKTGEKLCEFIKLHQNLNDPDTDIFAMDEKSTPSPRPKGIHDDFPKPFPGKGQKSNKRPKTLPLSYGKQMRSQMTEPRKMHQKKLSILEMFNDPSQIPRAEVDVHDSSLLKPPTKNRKRRSKTMPSPPSPNLRPHLKFPALSIIPPTDSDDEKSSTYSRSPSGGYSMDSETPRSTKSSVSWAETPTFHDPEISPPRTPSTPSNPSHSIQHLRQSSEESPLSSPGRESSKHSHSHSYSHSEKKSFLQRMKRRKKKKHKVPAQPQTVVLHEDVECDDEFSHVSISPDGSSEFSDLPALQTKSASIVEDSDTSDTDVVYVIPLYTVPEDSREPSRSESSETITGTVIPDADFRK